MNREIVASIDGLLNHINSIAKTDRFVIDSIEKDEYLLEKYGFGEIINSAYSYKYDLELTYEGATTLYVFVLNDDNGLEFLLTKQSDMPVMINRIYGNIEEFTKRIDELIDKK